MAGALPAGKPIKEIAMFKKILVATDGSDLSRKAVDAAISLAAQNQAELVALTVVPHYPIGYVDGAMAISAEEIAATEARWALAARKVLDGVAESARAKGIPVETEAIPSADVAETVISAARKHGSDLIVMASHGRKGVKRLLLGSETQHVLTHSELPVLVLR
jgi:nucleotide-binding universal stress UspA family protein